MRRTFVVLGLLLGLVGCGETPEFVTPVDEASARAALQGVWRFDPRDTEVGIFTGDGIRFAADGRYELLEVAADGTLVPVPSVLGTAAGSASFPAEGWGSGTVTMLLKYDAGSRIGPRVTWSDRGARMEWTYYPGFQRVEQPRVLQLRRSDAPVVGTVPPDQRWAPTTAAEGLALLEGVWLGGGVFNCRPSSGGRSGIRFDGTGRWQVVELRDDGTAVPVAERCLGVTKLALLGGPAGALGLRPDLPYTPAWPDLPMGGWNISWSAAHDGMVWDPGENSNVFNLRRSPATVAEPMPPPPYAPLDGVAAGEALVGTWRFPTPDVSFFGTVCDGVRFEPDGTFRPVDVAADGSVSVTPNSGTGTWVFDGIVGALERISLRLRWPSTSELDIVGVHWTDERMRMVWIQYPSGNSRGLTRL